MKYKTGTVLPSALLKDSKAPVTAGFNKSYMNYPLRAGIVIKSHSVESKGNLTKLTTEYDVLVMEQNAGKAITPITYKNCLAASALGSVADFFEAKLRTQKKVTNKQTKGKDFAGQNGAIVLLLCLDGSSEKGIIIGGLNHPDRKTKLKGEEQVMAAEFNGMSIDIADDGSAKLSFKGATDNDGKPKDSSQGTTTVDIEKDGSIQFKHNGATKRIEKGGNFLLQNIGTSLVESEGSITFKTKDTFNVEATGDGNVKVNALVLEAQGAATMTAQSFEFTAQVDIKMQAKMFDVKADSLAKIQAAQITMDGLTFIGGAGGQPICLPTTRFIGVGNQGSPVVSTAIGPFTVKSFAT